MEEKRRTTLGGAESHRLNLEREAWAADPPAILQHGPPNVAERKKKKTSMDRQTKRLPFVQKKNKLLPRRMKADGGACLEHRWEVSGFVEVSIQ